MVLPVPSQLSALLVVRDEAHGEPLNTLAGECLGLPVAGPAVLCTVGDIEE